MHELTYVAMMGVLRNVTSCMPFSSSAVDKTLMLDKQVIPCGATRVRANVALIAGYNEDKVSLCSIVSMDHIACCTWYWNDRYALQEYLIPAWEGSSSMR